MAQQLGTHTTMPSDLNSTHGTHMVEEQTLRSFPLTAMHEHTYTHMPHKCNHFFHFPMALLIPKEELVSTVLIVASNFVIWTHLKQTHYFFIGKRGQSRSTQRLSIAFSKNLNLTVLINVCMLGQCIGDTAHVWWSEVNIQELVLISTMNSRH